MTSHNQTKAQAQSVTTGGERLEPNQALERQATMAIIAASALFVLVGYAAHIGAPPLLDEQFLTHWLKAGEKAQGMPFFCWPGFESYDNWGPVTHSLLWLCGAVAGTSTWVFRLGSLLIHALSSCLLGLFVRRAGLPIPISAASAALFAVYPLSAEAVAWTGGFGIELAVMFLFGSLLLYMESRSRSIHWGFLGGSVALFALAMSSSASVFFAPGLLLVFELAALALPGMRPRNLTVPAIPIVLFALTAAAHLAATGMTPPTPSLSLPAITDLTRNLFMPINQAFWQGYSKQYRLLYFLLPVLLSGAGYLLARSRELRGHLIWAAGWTVLATLPVCGLAACDQAMYGSRLLYFAAAPLSVLLALGGSAAYYALANRVRIAGITVTSLLLVFLALFYCRHLWNETGTYRSFAERLKAVQKSISISQAKETGAPLFILRDLPRRLSVVPDYSLAGPRCFDAATGLLRSNPIPDGRLKDELRQGLYRTTALRWEDNVGSFIPLDLEPAASTWLAEPKPEDIAYRLEPKLPFYKTVHIDNQEGCLVLETNSENGPMISLVSCELSPLDGDYLYLDARINAPSSSVAPQIELHWQTKVHEHFEQKERFAYTPAVINDNQYHRYYLSLRSNGWTTGGAPKFIALGFPAGSKVYLKTVGVVSRAENIASLQPASSGAERSGSWFTPPYFNYPTSTNLGLVALDRNANALEGNYSVKHIQDATAALIEISRPNRSFDDANSDHLSSVTYTTQSLAAPEGSFSIPISRLMGPGVYSVRVIGTTSEGAYRGMFSDAVCYQVPWVATEK